MPEDNVVEQSQEPVADQTAPAAPEQPVEPQAPAPAPPVKPEGNAGMLAAIEEGLAQQKAAKDAQQTLALPKKPEDVQPKPEQPKPEKAEKPKRKSDEFILTDEERSRLTLKAQSRYHDVLAFAKKQEAVAEKFRVQNEALTQARDAIMSVLEETHTKPEHLTELLKYNSKVQTGDLEGALEMIEAQRAELLRLLGREAPGVDLLADFPDLTQRTENMELARQDAVEIANARRRMQMLQQQTTQQSTVQQQAVSKKQEQDKAIKELEQWSVATSRADPLNYKAKEAKIEQRLKKIMADYPPNMWVPVIRDMYEAIEVLKPESQPGPAPLRPGGNAGMPMPKDMSEAISRGLGYNG